LGAVRAEDGGGDRCGAMVIRAMVRIFLSIFPFCRGVKMDSHWLSTPSVRYSYPNTIVAAQNGVWMKNRNIPNSYVDISILAWIIVGGKGFFGMGPCCTIPQ
jgi:hypothetical protein